MRGRPACGRMAMNAHKTVDNDFVGNIFVGNKIIVKRAMVKNTTGPPVSGDNLFGRDAEIASLWQRLENNEHILMLAPRRVGKTSIMHELRLAPRSGWVVFYSDLEWGTCAEDCVADMLARMASNKITRTRLEWAPGVVPFRNAVRNLLRRTTAVMIESLRLELKGAMSGDWLVTAQQLQARLAALPAGTRVLFILDEFPILISTLLLQENGRSQVDQLLGWLRSLRQDPNLIGKMSFVIGGSIGLQNVLRRHNIPAPINDLTLFRVDPWSNETARAFLQELGEANGFPINEEAIDKMLLLLGEAVPYHVQLLFQEVSILCGNDGSLLENKVIERAFTQRLASPSGGPHLDHYAERLERVLTPDDVLIARDILDQACRSEQGVERTAISSAVSGYDTVAPKIIQLLEDDGYLIANAETLRFRSNLVREYWNRVQLGQRRV